MKRVRNAMNTLAFVLSGTGVLTSGATSTSRTTSSTAFRGSLVVAQRVEHLDVFAREPSVVEHPDATLFVAGYGEDHPTLWKSSDHGTTWARVDVGAETDGAIGNSDVHLAIDGDGTVYFLNMLFDRSAGEGRKITIAVSRDVGVHWSWKLLSEARFDDRPWVAVAPDGAVHVIWNDGAGVLHVVSRDRGASWTTVDRIHDQGGSSHLAVGPHGEVAVRIAPLSASGRRFDAGVDLIAVSVDGGRTWRKGAAPGQRDWSPELPTLKRTPRWVEPLAWDSAGQLYSLWTERDGVHLARSGDQGLNWKAWLLVSSGQVTYFPYLIAREPGELAATWFSGRGDALRWQAARIHVAGDSAPDIAQSSSQEIEAWRIPRDAPDTQVADTGGEYLGMTFLRSGGLGVVSPIHNRRSKRLGFTWWRFDVRSE